MQKQKTQGERMTELLRGPRVDLKSIARNWGQRREERGYRVDLHLEGSQKINSRKQMIRIGFDPQLGQPGDEDVDGFVRVSFPGFSVNWKRANYDPSGFEAEIRYREEAVPVASLKDIPAGFMRKATATYMKKEADGQFSVWRLEKSADGLLLVRDQDEQMIEPEAAEGMENHLVRTPEGNGIVIQIIGDKATVRMANGNDKEFGIEKLSTYDISKERSELVDYYTKAYGDPEYAKELAEGV